LVRFHHVPWDRGKGADHGGRTVPSASHILHLADRISVLVGSQREALGKAKTVCMRIQAVSGGMFMPQYVEAFRRLASREYFWLDAASPWLGAILQRRLDLGTVRVAKKGLQGVANLLARSVDFRSRFTASHSCGVAAAAEALARRAGLSKRECWMMRIAGCLHDLGKLVVPAEVLERQGPLTSEEADTMRSHTYHTYSVLDSIGPFDVIKTWAAYHHERLDGTGYPFHLSGKDLSPGARIMAVADVFTALTEDRAYRSALSKEEAVSVLERVGRPGLDGDIIALLKRHSDEVNEARDKAESAARMEYQETGRTGE